MCPNCIVYIALGMIAGVLLMKEKNDPKLNQSWEDMKDEIWKKEIDRIKKGSN